MSSIFPLTVPVVVWRYRTGGGEGYGRRKPATFEKETLLVFAVQIGGDAVATSTAPEAARWDALVYAPVGAGITDRDRIEYKGNLYNIDGPPAVYDANPWWAPGLVVCRCTLRKG